MELTGIEDLNQCRQKLEDHGWDIERAVQDTFNEREGVSGVFNETPDHPEPVRRRIPTAPPLVNNNRHQQRVFHPRANPDRDRWSLLAWGTQFLYLPFRFIYSSFYDLIRFFRLTDPIADVENFIREYNTNYGDTHPTFYHGTYSQALNDAKQELKFLIVYLHGDDHQDSDAFCRDTLSNENVIQFINDNSLFWACNINSGEGYRVSQALREHTYPFLAVILLKDSRMTVVARVEGLMSSGELLGALHGIKESNEMYLISERLERDGRLRDRTLREEQDEAYLESERQDREKARIKQEEADRQRLEEERRIQEEQERQQEMENREQLKVRWREELPAEPEEGSPDCIKVVIKLPSSTRIERRFLVTHSLKYLYYFVYCHEDAPNNFDIVTNFPRKTLPCKPTDEFQPPTFKDEGILKSEMLFIHDHDA